MEEAPTEVLLGKQLLVKLPFSHFKDIIQLKYSEYGPRRKKSISYSKTNHGSKSNSSLLGTRSSVFCTKRNFNSSLANYDFLNIIQENVMSKFISHKLNVGISTQFTWNNFWLPKISLTPQIAREIENNFSTEKKEIVSHRVDSISQNQQLESFLRWKGLVDDISSTRIHVCRLLDGKWAAITRDLIILLWDKGSSWNFDNVEIVFALPLKHIVALSVDPCLSVVYFVVGPECISKWDITPGEITKTESFISNLIVAALRVRCTSDRNEIGQTSKLKIPYNMSIYNTRFIEVIRMPILSIPSCSHMSTYICQDKEIVLYTGSAICKNVNGETDFQEEFMMQTGAEKFRPVDLSLRGKFLKTISSGLGKGNSMNETHVLCDVSHISSIRRLEDPRPHSVLITWNSIFIIFSASNSISANKLFERICFSRRQKSPQFWPAHVVVTDHSLLLFSTGVDKDLLFRTPILNMIINLLQHNGIAELLIENEISEAEETLSSESENPQWSIAFENPMEATALHRLLRKLSRKS